MFSRFSLPIIFLVTFYLPARADLVLNVPFAGGEQTFSHPDPAGAFPREVYLKLAYRVTCRPDQPALFNGITGSVTYGGRHTRFDLFADTDQTSLFLGTATAAVKDLVFKLDPAPNCQLAGPIEIVDRENEFAALAPKQKLAWRHAPYVVVKDVQYANRHTDLPLAAAYSYLEPQKGLEQFQILRITWFFTDEDTKTTAKMTQAQMGTYARAGDIEWVYDVGFLLAEFQEFVEGKRAFDSLVAHYKGFDATTENGWFHLGRKPFVGVALAGSEHLVLYNRALNNVFLDHAVGENQAKNPIGYALVPMTEIPKPEARELVAFENPWMLVVTDRELVREKKRTRPFDEYLYVLLSGKFGGGSLTGSLFGELKLPSGEVAVSGGGDGDFNRVGEDLWLVRGYTAIPFGKEALASFDQTRRATFRVTTAQRDPARRVPASFASQEPPSFYKFVTLPSGKWTMQDVTSSVEVDPALLPVK